MAWLYFGIAICLVLGLILFIVGWRGWRMDDHPHCRRCKYDLVGHEEAAVCPECGCSLARPRAIRQGLRRKRRLVLAIGCVLVLLAGAGGSRVAWRLATTYDWNRIKPVFLLHADAKRTGNPTVAEPALRELVRRLGNEDLSRSQVDSLVKTSLAMQRDDGVLWPSYWGAIMEVSFTKGLIDRDQMEPYLRTAAARESLELRTRQRVREGARVPLRLVLTQERVGVATILGRTDTTLYRHVEPLRVRVDGELLEELPLRRTAAHMIGRPVAAWQDGRLGYLGRPGKHSVELDVECYAAFFPLGRPYLPPQEDETGR